jgi:ATP-dependent Clp protease ATP-binding subunit ClpB
LQKILEIELGMVQKRILMAPGTRKFAFYCTQSAKDSLLKDGTDARYGVRHLKRAIERNLVFPLANLLATGQVKLGDFLRIDLSPEGCVTFVKEDESATNLELLTRCAGTPGMPSMTVQPAPSPVSSVLLHWPM